MDYEQEILDLIAGKIDQIEVDSEHFFEFNQAWLNCPQHKQIIGSAHRNGRVTYKFSENGSN